MPRTRRSPRTRESSGPIGGSPPRRRRRESATSSGGVHRGGDERALAERRVVSVEGERVAGARGGNQALELGGGADRLAVDLHDDESAADRRNERCGCRIDAG